MKVDDCTSLQKELSTGIRVCCSLLAGLVSGPYGDIVTPMLADLTADTPLLKHIIEKNGELGRLCQSNICCIVDRLPAASFPQAPHAGGPDSTTRRCSSMAGERPPGALSLNRSVDKL